MFHGILFNINLENFIREGAVLCVGHSTIKIFQYFVGTVDLNDLAGFLLEKTHGTLKTQGTLMQI